ncbi:hypothetical protein BH11CYA1_BH11CYA1_20860 [soil metagenome]
MATPSVISQLPDNVFQITGNVNFETYMNDDLRFIDNLLDVLNLHINEWDSDKVLEKADDVFTAFKRRFGLEDFLIRRIKPTVSMQVTLKEFLKKRQEFRNELDNILLLHVDEPDFKTATKHLSHTISKHVTYLKNVFEPSFINKIPEEQMASISSDFYRKVLNLSF